MKSEGMSYFTDMHWPLIGLGIFFISFFVLVYLQTRAIGADTLGKMARLPFEGDNHEL